jgi:predicted PilT family ATPase
MRLAEDSVTKTVTVKVKSRLLGRLLGKGGVTINKLKGDHGVKIMVPGKRDDSSSSKEDELVPVKVIGGCLSTDDAVAAIRELVEEATETMRMTAQHARILSLYGSGEGGRESARRQMQRTHGVSISAAELPADMDTKKPKQKRGGRDRRRGGGRSQEEDDDVGTEENAEPDKLMTIVGATQAVAAAKKALEAFVVSNHHDVLTVAEEMIGVVVGRGGKSIQRLTQESGARIDIQGTQVYMYGTAEQVQQAKIGVQGLIASTASTIVSLSRADARTVLGPKGATIKQIQADSGARIQVQIEDHGYNGGGDDYEEGSYAEIRGTPEQCAAAEAAIRETISGGDAVVAIPEGVNAGMIIGKGGETIRQLQQDSGARLQVEKDSGVVIIHGTLEQGELAEAALNALFNDLLESHGGGGGGGGGYNNGDDADWEVRSIEVGAENVGKVIGRGGSTIRTLSEESGAKVSIDRDIGEVTIEGTLDAVDGAVAGLYAVLNWELDYEDDYDEGGDDKDSGMVYDQYQDDGADGGGDGADGGGDGADGGDDGADGGDDGWNDAVADDEAVSSPRCFSSLLLLVASPRCFSSQLLLLAAPPRSSSSQLLLAARLMHFRCVFSYQAPGWGVDGGAAPENNPPQYGAQPLGGWDDAMAPGMCI